MDVKEFVTRRKELDDLINAWVDKFEKDSKLEVSHIDIDIAHVRVHGGSGNAFVRTNVELAMGFTIDY